MTSVELPHLYVSGPMTGYPEYNFPAFESAAFALRAAGFVVSSPHEVKLPCGCSGGSGCGSAEHVWSDYLRADLIEMLQGCQAVAYLSGWEKSRGAVLELHVANALGWPVAPVEVWLARAVRGIRVAG